MSGSRVGHLPLRDGEQMRRRLSEDGLLSLVAGRFQQSRNKSRCSVRKGFLNPCDPPKFGHVWLGLAGVFSAGQTA